MPFLDGSNMYFLFVKIILLTFVYFLPWLDPSESPDCFFDNGLCGLTGEKDWKIKSFKNNGNGKLLLQTCMIR